MNELDKEISFLKVIQKMMHIKREMKLLGGRHENDAEHSWHVAMFVLVFDKYLPEGLDKLKLLKMILIHDLVEVYAGDTFFIDTSKREEKKEKEKRAAKKLFDTLPTDTAGVFHSLFSEFEKNETDEAKFAHSFDKIQPVVMSLVTNGQSWKEHNLTKETVDKHKLQQVNHSPLTKKLYSILMHQAKQEGFYS